MTLWMTYIVLAAAVAGVSALPLLFAKRFFAYILAGIVIFAIQLFSLYIEMPGSSIPFYGVLGDIVIFAVVCFGISVFRSESRGQLALMALVPALAIAASFGSFIMFEWSYFHWQKYASFTGHVKESEWTKDIQPLDVERMLLVPRESAHYNADKAVGELGSLGSQFVLESENFSLSALHGRLTTVVPLDYRDFSVWWNSNGVPAYMRIDGHDVKKGPTVVKLTDPKTFFRYTPKAHWMDNLHRHLRQSGITHEVFLDTHFELDEEEKPWFIVTIGVPTIWSNGKVITGVVIVNPATGEFKRYALKDVPVWVDRVMPAHLMVQYLTWSGTFARGWWNSWWGKLDLTEPDLVVQQYSQEGRMTFVTGITSTSEKDNSLISIMYTDTRTGKHVNYRMPGGATVYAVENLVNSHPKLKFQNVHAGAVHMINAHGIATAMSPLLTPAGAYFGVAFVPVINPNAERLVYHEDAATAYKMYLGAMAKEGEKVDIAAVEKILSTRGKVVRIAQLPSASGMTYGLIIEGVKPWMYGSQAEFPALGFTREGDQVEVSYVDTTAESTSLRKFHNFSLPQRGGMIPQFNR